MEDFSRIELIHQVVSTNREGVLLMRKMMTENPAKDYYIPADVLTDLINLIESSTGLIETLMVQREDFRDQLNQK